MRHTKSQVDKKLSDLICYVNVPSSSIYGFEGTTNEEFQTWQLNVRKVLFRTSLKYIGEVYSNTYSSAHLWATAEGKKFYILPDSLGVEVVPKNRETIAVDLSEKFRNYLTSTDEYNFFKSMSDDEIQTVAKEIQYWIDFLNS